MSDWDVVVIGAGVAGYSAAIRLAQRGAKVCIIEKDIVGGTCLNRGCIPTKFLLNSAAIFSSIRDADSFGINVGTLSFNFNKMMQKKNEIVKRLVKGIEYLLQNYRIEFIKSNGRIITPNTVEIIEGEKRIKLNTKYIIIATGSEPTRPKWIRFDEQVITSDEALSLESFPKSIMIIGAGTIGCEFASLFNALGSEVTLIEIMPQILPSGDEEIVAKLAQIMRNKGIRIVIRVGVEELVGKTNIITGKLTTGEEITTEKVLVTVGRDPNARNMGIEEIGIKTEQGKILVNDRLETNIKGIYAIGDVVRGPMYAHKAYFDGILVAENIMGKEHKIDYSIIPNCIFTLPEVASVGMTEKDAEKRYGIKVGRFVFAGNSRAHTLNNTEGFVKIISEMDTERILGAHILGYEATELITQLTLAIKNNLTISNIIDTIFPHPTLSECIKESASDVKEEALHKVRRG